MDDIAAHLGMSKKTIYRHFKDKDEIINNLCKKDYACHRENLLKITSSSRNPIEEIFLSMKYMKCVFNQVNAILFYDLRKYHPHAWNQFREFKEKNILKVVENNIRKGVRKGLYRKNLDPTLMARLRIGEVEMAMDPEIFPPDYCDLHKVQLAMLEHFLYGIVTLKGYKMIHKYKKASDLPVISI